MTTTFLICLTAKFSGVTQSQVMFVKNELLELDILQADYPSH